MSDLQEQVQRLIDTAVADGAERGVQVAVYRNGEQVVDAVAGQADPATGRAMTTDTPVYVASTAKGVTATLAHVLVERGFLDYDTPVAKVWPEFGAHGKGGVTLHHVLTHTAGVPAVPADTTAEKLCDWDGMCRTIAESEPLWAPGEQAGYHAATFGYLVGEIVRRTTGKPASQALREYVAAPLGFERELFFSVPAAELPRVARLEDDPAGTAAFAGLPDEWPLFQVAPRRIIPRAELGNRTDILTHDMPFHGVVTARAIAGMYAALLGEVGGVRLISPARLAEATTLATDGLDDQSTGGPATYGLGYLLGGPGARPAADGSATMFGFVGIGGTGAYADRATGVSFAVTKNRMNPVDATVAEQVGAMVAEAYS
ncbi:MAG: serine hydrolase [Catenulispora sp. 13_1_20CM_3_70_7]|jgi:CubicO group peptidase (beta-lactamase class C family)|nr:MAG: serine hydrolase [Catenulispora sp. 13_1_20CM_3_70_7]